MCKAGNALSQMNETCFTQNQSVLNAVHVFILHVFAIAIPVFYNTCVIGYAKQLIDLDYFLSTETSNFISRKFPVKHLVQCASHC